MFALLTVVEGGVSGAMCELNLSCGALMRSRCTPLKVYEVFAKMLGVEDELTGPHDKFKVEGNIFWMECQVDYQGMAIQMSYMLQKCSELQKYV